MDKRFLSNQSPPDHLYDLSNHKGDILHSKKSLGRIANHLLQSRAHFEMRVAINPLTALPFSDRRRYFSFVQFKHPSNSVKISHYVQFKTWISGLEEC